MLYLDENGACEITLSNDTFFYLRDGEESILGLDENEVNSIYDRFENGFEICDYTLENDGKITALFVPYVDDDFVYNYVYPAKATVQFQFNIVGDNVSCRMHHFDDGHSIYYDDAKIQISERGNEYVIVGKSQFWLKGLIPV